MLKLILVVCFGVLLGGCRPIKGDRTFLEKGTCPTPCWQGLTPGISTRKDVVNVLTNPDLVEQDSIQDRFSSNDPAVETFTFSRKSDGNGWIGLDNDLLYKIRLGLGYDLELQEVIDAFGEPEYLYIEEAPNSCYSIEVLYPTQGFWIRINRCRTPGGYSREDREIEVRPDLLVDSVLLFEGASDLDLAVTNMRVGIEFGNNIRNHHHEWGGYDWYVTGP